MIKLFNSNMNEIFQNIVSYQINILPLDNFSAFGVMMDDEYFQTSEHAFQYLKFKNTNREIAEKIKNSFSPNEAREIAHSNKKYKPNNWNEIKYDLMEKVLMLKTKQNPVVLKKLLDTKDSIIAEYCTDQDTDWGVDNFGKGDNHLGKIWMKIRDEYKNN